MNVGDKVINIFTKDVGFIVGDLRNNPFSILDYRVVFYTEGIRKENCFYESELKILKDEKELF